MQEPLLIPLLLAKRILLVPVEELYPKRCRNAPICHSTALTNQLVFPDELYYANCERIVHRNYKPSQLDTILLN